MQTFLSKVFDFVKSNWKTIVVIMASCIVMWQINKIFSNKESSLVKQMDDLKKIHNEQIEQIKSAYDRELDKKEKNIKQLNQDLQDSKDEYDRLKQDIEDKKKTNIINTTKTYRGDPKGLAKKVNSVLGFEVVLPQGAK